MKISREEFSIVFKGGTQKTTPMVAISKKVAPKAVDRNRIKRIIIEAARGLNMPKGEFVISVKKNLKLLKTYEIQKKLEIALGKLK